MKIILLIAMIFMTWVVNAGIVRQIDGVASVTSTLFLEFDRTRNYLLIQNQGTSDIFMKVDSIHTANEGLTIPAGTSYEHLGGIKNSVFLKTASLMQAFVIFEG